MTKNSAAEALGRLGGRSRKGRTAKGHTTTSEAKNPAAVALGRLGGEANRGKTSEAKQAAAAANGAKGGRPSRYSRAEMLAAVRRLKTISAAVVAEDMGVSTAAIWAWKRKLQSPAKATTRRSTQKR